METKDQEATPEVTTSEEAAAAITKAKEQGYSPAYVRIGGKEFIYRGITRKEWREIVTKRNQSIIDAGENQVAIADIQENEVETIADKCLMYPEFALDKIGAGSVQHLADLILFESGFGGPDIEAVKL